jgi:hypothetical protein
VTLIEGVKNLKRDCHLFVVVIVAIDLVKIVKILKMEIDETRTMEVDETHTRAAGESEDSAAIVLAKVGAQVSLTTQ